MKSERNKTIDFSSEEGRNYLKLCDRAGEEGSILCSSAISAEDMKNKVFLGDFFQISRQMPKEFVDLLIVDPPYNLDKFFHGNRFQKSDDAAYEKYTISWVEQVLPLLKNDASVYVCCDWKSSLVIGSVLQRYFYVQNRITWQREKGRGAKENWKNGMEDIWFMTRSKHYTFHVNDVKVRRRVLCPYRQDGVPKDWKETDEGKFRDTCPSNFWDDISVPYWSMPENTAHPTQKPEKLLAKLILASSNPGDVVFDPFLGSGSTAVAAKKLGRCYAGVEQNEQYCAWAMYRLQQAELDNTIQGYTDGVFWERNTLTAQKQYQKGERA